MSREGASVEDEIFSALKDESTGEIFLLGAPLSELKNFQACCERKNLPPSVRKRLVGMVRSGTGNFDALLAREDLTPFEITTIARSPMIGPREAKILISHPSFSHQALAELAFIEERRVNTRLGRGLHASTAISGQILGVLRNANTLTRAAVLLVDEDVASSPQEIVDALDIIMEDGKVLEVFLVLVKGWYGTTAELVAASQALN